MARDHALMVIADIGGYTRFMRVHKINLAHAQYAIGQLMEAMLDALGRGWKLAKLEGDAAFVYRPLPGDAAPDGAELRAQLAAILGSFRARRALLAADRACSCDGCVQVEQLTLKFAVHAGEVAYQRVRRLTELAGIDVILVHRLLKNSVPIREYVLQSGELAERLAPALEPAVPIEEELEGIGRQTLYYVEADALGPAPAPAPPRRPLRVVLRWLRMTVRSLPAMIGLRRARLGDGNLAAICGAEPPAELTDVK